ncbi:hypothetical protein K438DRAFT_1993494 [Mycena galopus ATCC 62051]|nr:hypothetical protein K438DRAFT_1993494 [Mycena galopus ATCC 62051]
MAALADVGTLKVHCIACALHQIAKWRRAWTFGSIASFKPVFLGTQLHRLFSNGLFAEFSSCYGPSPLDPRPSTLPYCAVFRRTHSPHTRRGATVSASSATTSAAATLVSIRNAPALSSSSSLYPHLTSGDAKYKLPPMITHYRSPSPSTTPTSAITNVASPAFVTCGWYSLRAVQYN